MDEILLSKTNASDVTVTSDVHLTSEQVVVMWLANNLQEGDDIVSVPGNQMTSGVMCTLSCSLYLCSIQIVKLDWVIGVEMIGSRITFYWVSITLDSGHKIHTIYCMLYRTVAWNPLNRTWGMAKSKLFLDKLSSYTTQCRWVQLCGAQSIKKWHLKNSTGITGTLPLERNVVFFKCHFFFFNAISITNKMSFTSTELGQQYNSLQWVYETKAVRLDRNN